MTSIARTPASCSSPARASGGRCITTPWAKRFAIDVELAIYLYPKGQEPKYRTYLTAFPATPGTAALGVMDIPPNSITETEGYQTLEGARDARKFPAPHAPARQGHAAGSDLARRHQAHHQLRRSFQLQLDDQLHLSPTTPRRCSPRAPSFTWSPGTTTPPPTRTIPIPTQWVGWGDRTVDEMAHAWVNVTYISEEDYQEWVRKNPQANAVTAAR